MHTSCSVTYCFIILSKYDTSFGMTDSRTIFVLVTLGSPSHVFIVKSILSFTIEYCLQVFKFKPDLAIFSEVEDFMIPCETNIESDGIFAFFLCWSP